MAVLGGRRTAALSGAVLVWIIAACGSQEPAPDHSAPGIPNLALLRASVPDAVGVSTLTGAAGAVEANADVRLRRPNGPEVESATRAGADGGFVVSIAAQRLDVLEVVAVDAAGNTSAAASIAVGAPFVLQRAGAAQLDTSAGAAPSSPASLVLLDESGTPVPDVEVTFGALILTPSTTIVPTDAAGRASWTFTSPTLAAVFIATARVADALRAEPIEWNVHVLPGPVSRIAIVGGSEQIAAPGGTLPDLLRARTEDVYGNAVPAVPVGWSTLAGSLAPSAATTNAAGEAEARWTLPLLAGEYSTTARVSSIAQAVNFVGVAGSAPVIDSVTPNPVAAGGMLDIRGGPFSRSMAYNEVWFATGATTVRGTVESAGPDRLTAAVPTVAKSGDLLVRVCGRDAARHSLGIEGALGVVEEVPVGNGSIELSTPMGDEEFLLAVYSDATSNADYSVSSSPAAARMPAPRREATARQRTDPVRDFHAWLRAREHELGSAAVASPPAHSAGKPVAESAFIVLAKLDGSRYDQVTATLRYTGENVLLYVDNSAASQLSEANIVELGQTYDAAGGSYDAVRGAFGAESDLNRDGRIVVLLTPTVNKLTPPNSSSFVGGFFYARDLHAISNSNNMEIVYGIVPDPNNLWGNVFPVAPTMEVLHGVLPHEHQHLVSYYQHVLVRNGAPEELWLNEGLSHVAEELAGFHEQNILRGSLFLDAPHSVSLTAGGNALAERGMSYLFLRFVGDHQDAGFFSRLVLTSRVGRANLDAASGVGLVRWLGDWAAALWLDGSGLSVAAAYRYSSIDYAGSFAVPTVEALSLENPSKTGSLLPASLHLYRLGGSSNPSTQLQVAGNVRALVVRIH